MDLLQRKNKSKKHKVHTGAPASNQRPRSICPARLLGPQIFGDAEVTRSAIWQSSGAEGRPRGGRRCRVATRWYQRPAFDLHGAAGGPADSEKKALFGRFYPKICTLCLKNKMSPTLVLNLFQQVLLGNPVLGHKKIGADKHLESIKRSTDLKSSRVPSCNYQQITRFFLGQHHGDPWECLEKLLPRAIQLKRTPPSRVGSH